MARICDSLLLGILICLRCSPLPCCLFFDMPYVVHSSSLYRFCMNFCSAVVVKITANTPLPAAAAHANATARDSCEMRHMLSGLSAADDGDGRLTCGRRGVDTKPTSLIASLCGTVLCCCYPFYFLFLLLKGKNSTIYLTCSWYYYQSYY